MMLGNGSKRLYDYDMRSQLTTQVELNASNVPIVTLIDSYDAVGNRMTRGVNGTVATWTYDNLYRLTGQVKPGQVATYTLDGVGNLKVMWEGGSFPKTFAFNAADSLVTMIEGAQLTTYTHTGYGALASEVTGSSSTGYAYNGQDQLIEVTDPSGAKTTYSFDGDGLRRSTLYEDQGQDPPLEMRTTFVWDGSDYLLLNGPSSSTVVLTLGGEIVSSGSFDLLPDSLGSVIGDIRSGQDPRVIFDYWPYGTMLPSPFKASFPFLFVGSLGYYHDSESRDYVRARELMKSTGRWMQVDPLWPEERAFEYANSSPNTRTDPFGLFSIDSSCNGCSCKSSLDSILRNTCGSSGSGGVFGLSDRLWREIFECARMRVPSTCPTPTGVSWQTLRNCIKGTCSGSKKVICQTCPYCAYNTCNTSNPGNPSQPSDIVVCVNHICTQSGGWNPGCGCQAFGGKCGGSKGHEGTCMMLHEMAHACGFCSGGQCDQLWSDAIACCIINRLYR
ncbi:MAG: hypothetical protein D8M22_07190 [Armatimonadetes bacterium]|nr:hypothetical protein [Armatimonadota bacterium]GIK32355.1 MAG: hypothetical protein BroJett009_13470 [Armatimonadota bacterium]